MPISGLDGCTADHWDEVREILMESIEDAGFQGNLVSSADEVGIIQKAIIQNLYENVIVVCDVSGKNPNVMFELGLRLAFDKPVIIVKDDKTSYSFDTGQIEHIEYPRDLRFSKIIAFKEKLASKISKTHERATTDPNFTTFLRHFGEFKVAKIEKKEVPGQELILEELSSLRQAIQVLSKYTMRGPTSQSKSSIKEERRIERCLRGVPEAEVKSQADLIRLISGVGEVRILGDSDHLHMLVYPASGTPVEKIHSSVMALMPEPTGPRAGRGKSKSEK